MPSTTRDESKDALLEREIVESIRDSLDIASEDESALLVSGEQKGSTARAYYNKKSGIFTSRWPGRRGICLCFLVLLGLVAAIASSGYFVYQIEPTQGLSPPCMKRVRMVGCH